MDSTSVSKETYYGKVALTSALDPRDPRLAPYRMRKIWATCAALLVLLACSGGMVESPALNTSEKPYEPPAADERSVVVAFGDSLTAGYGVPPGSSFPDFLQKEFESRGLNYKVINEGISGETTAQGLIRSEIVLSRKPAWVILAYGANDGLRGLSTERMEANLRTIANRFLDSDVDVLLAGMRLPPNYGTEYVQMFEAIFPRLAKELDVPFIPFLLEGVAGKPELNQPDGIHPNVEGNRLVAAHVADFFEKAIKP